MLRLHDILYDSEQVIENICRNLMREREEISIWPNWEQKKKQMRILLYSLLKSRVYIIGF